MATDLSQLKYPDFSTTGYAPKDFLRSSPWTRLFPLVSPQELRDSHLHGIPLRSFFPDPVTGQYRVWTDADLAKAIQRAVSRVEAKSQCLIAPSEIVDTYPFDRQEYESFGYMQLKVRPVYGLLKLQVVSADKVAVFDCPVNWVTTANLLKGQVNILPMGAASPLAVSASTPPFLIYLSRLGWIPQFWQIQYVAGFKDFLVPDFVNDLVAVTAAMDVLSQLGATYAWMTGGSLGIDGLSQSSSGPGPQVFAVRIQELKELEKQLLNKFKALCGMKISAGAV